MDYQQLCTLFRWNDPDIHSVFRSGSHVYGTASSTSDEDFVVLLHDSNTRPDLLFRPQVNVNVHSIFSFQTSLNKHSIFALECFFLPQEHRLKESSPKLQCTLNAKTIFESANKRALSDFKKSARCFEHEPFASKKKLFHAIRVLMFARQLIRHHTIVDYAEANSIWYELCKETDQQWSTYPLKYEPLFEQLLYEIKQMSS